VYRRLRIFVSPTLCRPGSYGLYAAVSRAQLTVGLEFTGHVHSLTPWMFQSPWEHWLRPLAVLVPSAAAAAVAASVTDALGLAAASACRRERPQKRAADHRSGSPAATRKAACTVVSRARAAEHSTAALGRGPAAEPDPSAGSAAANPKMPAQGRAPAPFRTIKTVALRQAVAAGHLAAAAKQAPPSRPALPGAQLSRAPLPPAQPIAPVR
jgi:hypothetical protein